MTNQETAIRETQVQFDKKGIHVYFCRESGSFKMLNSSDNNDAFAQSMGYDSIIELLDEMNTTYHALLGTKYTIEITLNTLTEVRLYLAKIGMKNSRILCFGEEINPDELLTENND